MIRKRLTKKRGWYHAIYYDTATKRTRWEALHTKNKREAEQRIANPKGEDVSYRLHESWEAYEQSRARVCTDSTLRDIKYFGRLVKELDNVEVAAITTALYSPIFRRKITKMTQAGYYRRLRAFINWGIKNHYLPPDSPMPEKFDPPRIQALYFTREEFDRLRQVTKQTPAFDALVVFAVSTGMRLSEILSLKYTDIRDQHLRVAGKGGHVRYVPLLPSAQDVLSRMNPLQENLFSGSVYSVSSTFKEARRAAGLREGLRFHSLRHTFASWLVMDGIPLSRIRNWMGHSTISVTEGYAHLSPEGHQEDASKTFTIDIV